MATSINPKNVFDLIDESLREAENNAGQLYTLGFIKKETHSEITDKFLALRESLYSAMNEAGGKTDVE